MTAEASSAALAPRPQCPRCRTVLPLVGPGTQVLRCTGCGAALQVTVRPMEPSGPPVPSTPPTMSPGVARPRRQPMVEVPSPRRAEVAPPPATHTITVELSQTDIEFEPETETLATPTPVTSTPAPAPPSTPPPSTLGADVPWFAEDIEWLPEANVDLGQLVLETLEPHPPLPLRLEVAPSRPPGAPASHSREK